MERVFTGRELVNTSSRLERNAAIELPLTHVTLYSTSITIGTDSDSVCLRLRFSMFANILRLTNACIIIIIITVSHHTVFPLLLGHNPRTFRELQTFQTFL